MKGFKFAAVVASALTLSAASAMAGGWQIDIDGLYANPTGSLGDTDTDLKDLVDGAIGFRGDVLYGLSDSFSLGVGAGWWKNNESEDVIDLGEELSLTSVPLHGIVMWQTAGDGPVGFWLRGGAGLTSHKVDGTFGDDSQSSFSWEVGGGLAVAVSDTWDITGGVAYNQASTSDGDVWDDGDNPKFWLFSVGLRYRTKAGE